MIKSENNFSKKDVDADLFYAFDRINNQSFYVINCIKKEFLQISENNILFCGQSSQKMREMDYQFYHQCIPDREQPLLERISKAVETLLECCLSEDKKKYVFKFNLHLENEKEEILVCHTATFIKLSKCRDAEFILYMISLPLNKGVGSLEAYDGKKLEL